MNTEPKEAIESRCEDCFGIGQEVKIRPLMFWRRIAAPPTCQKQLGFSEALPSAGQPRHEIVKADRKQNLSLR